MTKNDFLRKFTRLNDEIEEAITSHRFDEVIEHDLNRKRIIQDFKSSLHPDGDIEFIKELGICIDDSIAHIAMLKAEMRKLSHTQNRHIKAFATYQKRF